MRAVRPEMRVLVTDGDTRAALACVRSLGRRGHEVTVAAERHPSLASVSRFSAGFEAYPDPWTQERSFIESIVEIASRRRTDVVLAVTDVTTSLLSESRQLLPRDCYLPLPDFESVSAAADKARMVQLAESMAVPVPRGTILEARPDDGEALVGGLEYPVVIKPARSRYRAAAKWHSTGVRYAHDEAALRSSLSCLPPEAYPVLLQERIQGPGVGLFACFRNGLPVAIFSHRRLREKPPSGGVSVLCESTPPDPRAVEYATRLLSRLKWNGAAMVEFKRDARDDSLKLMEINGRLWGSLELAIASGVDFPRLLVEGEQADLAPPGTGYRVGVRMRWLGGDFDALVTRLTAREGSLDLPPCHPGRLKSLWNFVKTFGGRVHYELEQFSDMPPALLEWKRRFTRRA